MTTSVAPAPSAVDVVRRVPLFWRVVMIVVVAVLCLRYLSALYGGVIGTQTQTLSPTSALSTHATGTAAFVEFERRAGHAVEVTTSALSSLGSVPSNATLFVIDQVRWSAEDTAVVRALLARDVRVVFVGEPPSRLLATVTHNAVTWSNVAVQDITGVVTSPLTRGVSSLVTGNGGFTGRAGAHGLVLADEGVTYVAQYGSCVFIASSAPFQNQNLASADDAALAWNTAGLQRGEVIVDEYASRSVPTSSGFHALPIYWQSALVLLAVAILVWIVSASRRFGPPEILVAELGPPRSEYVEALTTVIAAQPNAPVADTVSAVSAAARTRLWRTLEVDDVASDVVVRAAARERGLPNDVVEAVLRPVATQDDAVALGRALSWLSTKEGNI